MKNMIDITVIYKDDNDKNPYFGFINDFPGICASAFTESELRVKLKHSLIEFVKDVDLNTQKYNEFGK